MAQQTLDNIFDTYLDKKSFFKSKKALQEAYTPDNLPHREEQITKLATILMTSLRGEKPSNVFIYGKTGTGKTAVSLFVGNALEEKARQKNTNLKYAYINCKMEKIQTSYRVLTRFFSVLNFKDEKSLPPTGLPTDEVRTRLINALNKNPGTYLLILDEIDSITDLDILYDLTRINTALRGAQISIVGISNDLSFTNQLDPRIKSSLSEEELVFPPYNALQLQNILTTRAHIALSPNIYTEEVIPKCAALAAQEHGDARRALDLLRVSCEIAERKNEAIVTQDHVSMAQKKIDLDRTIETSKTQPKQSQVVLYSIIYLKELNKEDIATGDVFEAYQSFCRQIRLDPLTQRRVSDLIAELDMLGLINAKVISKGRYGRTRKIKFNMSDSVLQKCKEVLEEELF